MELLNIESKYTWDDIKENGSKNPRAKKKRKITDEEYLFKLEMRNNNNYLYAQK